MVQFPPVTYEDWCARVAAGRDPGSRDGCRGVVREGLDLAPLASQREPDGAGFPGLAPFTRGPRPLPSARRWERRQAYRHPDPERVAEQIAADVSQGVDGVWLRLGSAARRGETPRVGSTGAGADGMVVATVPEMLAPLRAALGCDRLVSLTLDAGGNALPAAALTLAAIARLGGDVRSVPLRFGADPLGALAADGWLPSGIDTLSREAALLAGYCSARLPCSLAASVSMAPYARAGADAVQQVGWAVATGVQMLRAFTDAGLPLEQGIEQLSFSFELGRDWLVEICKLRAFRLLWSKAQRACGLEPCPARVHAVSGWRTWTRRDPYTNALRATVQACSAVLGGAEAVTVEPFDAALGDPSPRARRMARNTHALLAEESGLAEVLDPVGGAYAIEQLTDQLAHRAWDAFRQVEDLGMAAALQAQEGRSPVRDGLAKAVARRRRGLLEGADAVLGVTCYRARERTPDPADAGGGDSGDIEAVVARIERRLASRSSVPHLQAVREASQSVRAESDPVGLVEALVEAADQGASIAELSEALRQEPPLQVAALAPWRDEEAAERAGAGWGEAT